jgi:hypothetical protein
MRIAYPTFAALMLAGAVPSVTFAQIVVPYGKADHVDRLDHVLPVAVVTRSGDAIALTDPKPGAGFVLGAATLDITDPEHPRIVFTVGNATQTAIPLSRVHVHVATVNALADDESALFVPCGYSGWMSSLLRRAGSGVTVLEPGATLTLAVPVGPHCGPDKDGRPRPNVGFLVHLGSDGTPWVAGPRAEWGPAPSQLAEDALLRSAFGQLRSRGQHQ